MNLRVVLHKNPGKGAALEVLDEPELIYKLQTIANATAALFPSTARNTMRTARV